MDKGQLIELGLVVILVVGVGFLLYDYNKISRENKFLKENSSALHDSLRVVTTENGNLLATSSMFEGEIENLRKELGITKTRFQDILNSTSSSIENLAEVKLEFFSDTIRTALQDSAFSYKDEYVNLSGIVGEDCVQIDKVVLDVVLDVGNTTDGTFFALTDNPHVNITQIRAGTTPSTKSRWSAGIIGGVGIQYGLVGRNIDVGPTIGVGITYRLF